MLSCLLLAELPSAQAFTGRDGAEDLWARSERMPAGGGGQRGLGRGEDDLRVQRWDEVAYAAGQGRPGMSASGPTPGAIPESEHRTCRGLWLVLVRGMPSVLNYGNGRIEASGHFFLCLGRPNVIIFTNNDKNWDRRGCEFIDAIRLA